MATPQQVRLFYHLFRDHDFAFIVDEPVPRMPVDKYTQLRPIDFVTRWEQDIL